MFLYLIWLKHSSRYLKIGSHCWTIKNIIHYWTTCVYGGLITYKWMWLWNNGFGFLTAGHINFNTTPQSLYVLFAVTCLQSQAVNLQLLSNYSLHFVHLKNHLNNIVKKVSHFLIFCMPGQWINFCLDALFSFLSSQYRFEFYYITFLQSICLPASLYWFSLIGFHPVHSNFTAALYQKSLVCP